MCIHHIVIGSWEYRKLCLRLSQIDMERKINNSRRSCEHKFGTILKLLVILLILVIVIVIFKGVNHQSHPVKVTDKVTPSDGRPNQIGSFN